MKNNMLRKTSLLIVALLSVFTLSAQGLKNIQVSEVLVINTEDGIADSHGERVGWIELFNSGYSTVNVANCYISIAPINVTKEGDRSVDRLSLNTYRFPQSAISRMDIAPQSYLLVYAGGDSSYSPFNTSFTLDQGSELTLWDSSGKGEPLTALGYDINAQKAGVSIVVSEPRGGDKVVEFCEEPTPGHASFVEPVVSPAEMIKEQDPIGIGMTLVAVFVVFSALMLLYLIFRTVGKIMQARATSIEEKAKPASTTPEAKVAKAAVVAEGDVSGEVAAAIAYALKAYQEELEAAEEMALTLSKVAKAYSPWSSKIHGLTREPRKR